MNSPPNNEWEEGLDIDDSDLILTPVVRPTNNPHIVPEITTTTQTLILAQNHQVDTYAECEQSLDIDDSDLLLNPIPIRIILGPASIVQMAKLHKLVDTREGGEESVMSTQEYIRKVIEDVGEDDDFTRALWLSAIDYVNVDEGIVMSCDLTVTLKDLSGTIFGTIHYEVFTEERFAKDITVGAALILHNVFVFSPK
ncbi:hypothetical protein Tco_0729394 [Tanacetum coccineum]|uniref:Homologous recombination OB-fold protein OB-fold domain-containing protein n=1 Tax=Tanacetum coccineum TaxID=301880 RepID=A0ABQ4YNV1_9ASTR